MKNFPKHKHVSRPQMDKLQQQNTETNTHQLNEIVNQFHLKNELQTFNSESKSNQSVFICCVMYDNVIWICCDDVDGYDKSQYGFITDLFSTVKKNNIINNYNENKYNNKIMYYFFLSFIIFFIQFSFNLG